MSSASNFRKFVVGAVLGGAIGAVVGMLLAPRSGVETREMIREELDQQMRGVGDSLKEKTEALKDKADVIKDKVAEVTSELEEVGRRVMNRFSEKPEKS